jgi:hypothetical protein
VREPWSIGIPKYPLSAPKTENLAPRSARKEADAAARGRLLWTYRCDPLGEALEASVPVEAPRRLDCLQFHADEITDCLQRIGGGAVLQADRQSFQPSGTLAL